MESGRGQNDRAPRVSLAGKPATSIKTKTLCAVTAWVAIVSISFVWNYYDAKTAREKLALDTARSFFEEILITRQWNAEHGVVYVPATKETPPNPYIDLPGRDIRINRKLTLTMMNPAYMTRQISEIAARQKGITFRITSLLPLRPANKPTPLEAEALETFARGRKEVGRFIGPKGHEKYFYMAPLITKKACLDCHAKQGYEEGDIRGGISVTIPFTPHIPFVSLAAGHVGIGLAGIIGLLFFGAKLESYTGMLQQQAVIDALTGIHNRRYFSETILREFRRAKREHLPLSLIMCDIDKFKNYNDSYGHAAGDECLVKVAREVEKSLRRAGDFCARYGGEELVIILADTSLHNALQIGEKIRQAVMGLGIVHETSLPWKIVTLSIGVATMETTMTLSHEDLIRKADEALYKAKEGGRNRVEAYQEDTSHPAT
jgi:diguanylate cyclase (GGDEF)-like protein